MSKQNDGGPAFPSRRVGHSHYQSVGVHGLAEAVCVETAEQGMSLRDYFAASAPITFADAVMAADVHSNAPTVEAAVCRVLMQPELLRVVFAKLAALRLEYADAVLEARQS